jgi:hypothetical protein
MGVLGDLAAGINPPLKKRCPPLTNSDDLHSENATTEPFITHHCLTENAEAAFPGFVVFEGQAVTVAAWILVLALVMSGNVDVERVCQ